MTQDYMMTKTKRTEAIDRLKHIISAVFAAEAAISKDWKFKLKAAKNLGKEEREKLADEYLEAIAEEIISGAEKQESTKKQCDMKRKRVYISGPMSGLERKEYTRRFGIAEGILRKHGYDTINPARVWTSRWPWLYRIIGYKMTLLYDLWLLLFKADMICRLPGYEASRGSCIEWTVGSYFYLNGFPLKIEAEIRQAINNSKP